MKWYKILDQNKNQIAIYKNVRFDKNSILKNIYYLKKDDLAISNVLKIEVDILKLVSIKENISNIFIFETIKDDDL